ncbi:MAG: phosphate ABC transporter permease subunit PstC [Victivallales bacterium]
MATVKKQFLNHNKLDKVFRVICVSAALLICLILAGVLVQLLYYALPAVKRFGFNFLVSSNWDPVNHIYGALPAITGTLLTTAIALLIAVPVSFIVAMYLVESASPYVSAPIGFALDLLAAVPSIIYGMWGLFVFIPFMQKLVRIMTGITFNGYGFLTSGIILALMILPFICAIMRDVFKMVPPVLKEAAFGAGATSWEVTCDINMKYGAGGLLGAIFLGLGRAVGETMAVLFVVGNIQAVPRSLLSSGTTIAATLANNFSEAEGILKSVLFELGLILLLISLAIQIVAQLWLNRVRKQMGEK